MSSVRVAVPLFRGKRRFHLEKGRRWSVAEHIVLSSLAERPRSADELAREGRMHRRLALEMLIRLMRAGWVELQPDGSSTVFQASPAGVTAAARAELPVVARPPAIMSGRRPVGKRFVMRTTARPHRRCKRSLSQ